MSPRERKIVEIWHPQACARLIHLREVECKSFNECGRIFGVSAVAAQKKYYRLTDQRPRARNQKWSAEEDAVIRSHARGKDLTDHTLPGRSGFACRIRFCHLTKRASRENLPRLTALHIQHQRKLRPLVYRTPYGEQLGEPPIGRSALDHKLAGQQDTVETDGRKVRAYYRTAITLPDRPFR